MPSIKPASIRSSKLKLRRATAADWTSINPVLENSEPGYEEDTGKFKLGDGETAWASLAYSPPTVESDDRLPLRATSDRVDGPWDPNVTGNFDNTDLSKVVLQIPTPGRYLVGWRGYVRSNAGAATMEVDVYLSPAGQSNPYAASELYPDDIDYYIAFSVIEGSSNSLIWLQAMTEIVIPEPSQIAAQIYTNSGAMRVHQFGYLAMPQLFAWPT